MRRLICAVPAVPPEGPRPSWRSWKCRSEAARIAREPARRRGPLPPSWGGLPGGNEIALAPQEPAGHHHAISRATWTSGHATRCDRIAAIHKVASPAVADSSTAKTSQGFPIASCRAQCCWHVRQRSPGTRPHWLRKPPLRLRDVASPALGLHMTSTSSARVVHRRRCAERGTVRALL